MNAALWVGLVWTAFANDSGTLTLYDNALPTTLNPLYAQTMVDQRVLPLVFDRVFYRSSIR